MKDAQVFSTFSVNGKETRFFPAVWESARSGKKPGFLPRRIFIHTYVAERGVMDAPIFWAGHGPDVVLEAEPRNERKISKKGLPSGIIADK